MKKRVLLAGCDTITRQTCHGCLEHNGYEVHLASDGLECWAKLTDVRPIAAVLGDSLPWGGADGVISRLRDEPSEKSISVIFITDKDDLQNRGELIAKPVVACLPVPIHADALLGCLRDIERQPPS